MQSKLLKRFWARAAFIALTINSLAAITGAEAAIGIVPEGVPNPVVDTGDANRSVFYLDTSYTGQFAPTYAEHDFSNVATQLTFSISGAEAAKGFLWVFAQDRTDINTHYPIAFARCDAGTIGGNGECASGSFTDFIIGISLKAVCAGLNGPSIRGCDGNSPDVTGPTIDGFRFRFLAGTATMPTMTERATGSMLQVFVEVAEPTVSGTLSGFGFVPGDESINVDVTGITGVPGVAAPGSPIFTATYIAAQEGALPTLGSELTSTVVAAIGYGSGNQEITGFRNSTSSTQIFYGMAVGVLDAAGAVAFSTTTYPNVFATDIQGFLRESNCFIATASYRDGRAPGVMLLREFRDEILSESTLGRNFIGWYYERGPAAADWLLEHSIFRAFFLMLLLPLQALAWILLNPAILLVPLLSGFGLLGFLFRRFIFRRSRAPILILAGMMLIAPEGRAAESNQPYIDSLISGLPTEKGPRPTSGNPDPYIQSIKGKLKPEPATTNYIDEVKRDLPRRDGSEGYTNRLKSGMPTSEGSALEDYRHGKKLRANKGNLDTRSAFGFNIQAASTRTYTAGAQQDIPYQTVYGDGWIPDLTLHFEYRPFTLGVLKKFGLYGSLGAAFTKANGIYNYQDPDFGNTSQTEFTFISLPVNVGLIYRFNLFGVIYPYFAGGPSAIGFIENRNDKQPGNKGYTFGYWFMGGVAFGLDWMSAKNSWAQYETAGIKHSYFTIDYSYLESLSGGLVDFTVDGIKAGFTFEL